MTDSNDKPVSPDSATGIERGRQRARDERPASDTDRQPFPALAADQGRKVSDGEFSSLRDGR
jgi:hypothetical protein